MTLWVYIALSIIQTCIGYLHFSSQSSKVTVNDISKINAIGSGSFSISLFFQGTYGLSSGPRSLLSTRKKVAYQAFMVAFHGAWSVYTGYRPFIQLRYNYISYSSEQLYTDGNWQHLVISRYNNVADNKCELNYYINTTRIYSTAWENSGGCSTTITSDGVLYIGYDVGTTGWTGNISEVSFWKKALTQSEIEEIYKYIALEKTSLPLTDDLVHYYPLDESHINCQNDMVIHDVWNHHDGILSSSTDPKCIDDESTEFFGSNRTYHSNPATTSYISTEFFVSNRTYHSNPAATKDETESYIPILIGIASGLLVCGLVIYYFKWSKKSVDNDLGPKDADVELYEIGIANNARTEVVEVEYNNNVPTAPTEDTPPPSYFQVEVDNNNKTTDGADFEYENIATTKREDFEYENETNGNDEGECEGIKNKNMNVKQWFNDLEDLDDEDKGTYFHLFIENGFDKFNIVKNMNDNDLIQIGINKLGHRKLIMMAIAKLSIT